MNQPIRALAILYRTRLRVTEDVDAWNLVQDHIEWYLRQLPKDVLVQTADSLVTMAGREDNFKNRGYWA